MQVISRQQAGGIGPITSHLNHARTVRHGQGVAAHFQAPGLGIKSARPDVLLDYPQVQAAASFIRQEPLGYGREEASANSLTGTLRHDVEII
jgi:hypothetical protein